MYKAITRYLMNKCVLVPLTFMQLFFCITSCLLIKPPAIYGKTILEYTAPPVAHKMGTILFTINSTEPVATVTLFYKTDEVASEFKKVTCKQDDTNRFSYFLELSALKTQPDIVYYYFEASNNDEVIEKTQLASIQILKQVELSEVIKISTVGEPVDTPIWQKWWFWVPVTVAVGAGVWLLSDTKEKVVYDNVDLSEIRIIPLFSETDTHARCEVINGIQDCHTIYIYPVIPCEILKLKFEADILNGSPPFTVSWIINRWRQGQLEPEQLIFNETTSRRGLVTPEIEYCVLYEQLFSSLEIKLTVTDKHGNSDSRTTSLKFTYDNGL